MEYTDTIKDYIIEMFIDLKKSLHDLLLNKREMYVC